MWCESFTLRSTQPARFRRLISPTLFIVCIYTLTKIYRGTEAYTRYARETFIAEKATIERLGSRTKAVDSTSVAEAG